MSPPARRRLLSIDDPLEMGGRRESPPTAAAPEEPKPAQEVERRALFVRLPVAEADAVARAAFELGVHKQDLVAALVRRYVDTRSPEGLAALREMLRQTR